MSQQDSSENRREIRRSKPNLDAEEIEKIRQFVREQWELAFQYDIKTKPNWDLWKPPARIQWRSLFLRGESFHITESELQRAYYDELLGASCRFGFMPMLCELRLRLTPDDDPQHINLVQALGTIFNKSGNELTSFLFEARSDPQHQVLSGLQLGSFDPSLQDPRGERPQGEDLAQSTVRPEALGFEQIVQAIRKLEEMKSLGELRKASVGAFLQCLQKAGLLPKAQIVTK